jgi:hypothetical protein
MSSWFRLPFLPNCLLATALAAVAGASALQAQVTLEVAKTIPQVAHLRPRPGLEIPNPPFSLAGLDAKRKPAPAVARQWQDLLALGIDPPLNQVWLAHLEHPVPGSLPAHRFAFFGGIGMEPMRRLLQCYYENTGDLSTEDVFALAPWVNLALRNAISITLIDVVHPLTWYPVGFLYDVPLECIIDAYPHDAYTPMERPPYDQKAFREVFHLKNPWSDEQAEAFEAFEMRYRADHPRARVETMIQAFEQQPGHVSTWAYGPKETLRPPSDLVGVPPFDYHRYGYNEVATFSRITEPARSVRIIGVALIGRGRYKNGALPPDIKPDGFYEALAKAMAERLHLPLYDLRRNDNQ